MVRLGVNIDHVATLREVRKTRYPNPIAAAALVEKGGADQITVHLREDRRHIRDADLFALRSSVSTSLNLEMAPTKEMLQIACEAKPDCATLVPERREELTTEGGLDVNRLFDSLQSIVHELKQTGILVSLFIEPDKKQIEASVGLGADRIEIHTGRFSEQMEKVLYQRELNRIKESASFAHQKGLFVAAGHGLNYDNIEDIVRQVPQIEEYNIGHSIVSRALFVGLERAVEEMIEVIQGVQK